MEAKTQFRRMLDEMVPSRPECYSWKVGLRVEQIALKGNFGEKERHDLTKRASHVTCICLIKNSNDCLCHLS